MARVVSTLRAVNWLGSPRLVSPPAVLFSVALSWFAFPMGVGAATPYTSATVTKVENRVSYGDAREGRTRRAEVTDVVRASNYVLTQTDSRAELQYQDGSLVRVGQNTVFTFDASSRTLSLDKGTFIFHVPKGSGGGVIKTPSLTAAITGTSGKVSENIIAVVEGEVRLVPSGRLVRAGEFARRNADGSITIALFDPATVNQGLLVNFNGPMPGFNEELLQTPAPDFSIPDLRYLEVLQRTQNLPSSVDAFTPPPEDKPEEEEEEVVRATPRPTPRPTPTPPPHRPPPPPPDDGESPFLLGTEGGAQ